MIGNSEKKHYTSTKSLQRLYNKYDRYDLEKPLNSSIGPANNLKYLYEEINYIF